MILDFNPFHSDGISQTYYNKHVIVHVAMYFKGLQVKISKFWCICVHKANNAGLDEMSPYTAFHLLLHCLPKYLFTGMQKEYHQSVR